MMNRSLFSSLARKQDPELVRTSPVAPLPMLNGHAPVILIFDPRELAIELAYERFPQPGGIRVRSTTRESTLYWIPRLTPVFAVSEGFIVYARQHTDGHTILIDHRNGWASVYSRLDHMFVTPSDRSAQRETRVAAGDLIGYVSTLRPAPLMPLRFELWRCNHNDDFEQIDPLRYIRRWRQLPWSDSRVEFQTQSNA